ncbi:MAG: zinc-binding dehydrogenase [Halobacteriales archaeon]|nr:zinc-binding dehydrogenase [Halobacteriales archaeon]
METRTLVMEEPGELREQTIELPALGSEELRVKITLSGICGSDVHMYEGGMELDFPVVPGHEMAGTIEAMGVDVTTDSRGDPIAEGDTIAIVPGTVCGECWFCQNVPSRPTTCRNRDVYGFMNAEYGQRAHGGFSQYMIVDEAGSFYRLPEHLDPELGALVEPLAVATRALERGYPPGQPDAREGFGIGKSVVVQGAGPIGLLTMSAAHAGGAGQVIAVDAIDERLDLATEFGATDTVDLTAHEDTAALAETIHDRTPGSVGADVVIEAAGQPEAFRQSIEFVRDGGTVVEVGHYAYSGEVDINPTRIVQKDIDIRGSLAYPPTQFETGIALLDQLADEVPFGDLFNYRVGFDDAEEAYEKQASGDAYRATIHPWGV